VHDKIRPQVAAHRDPGRDGSQLDRLETPGLRDEAAQRVNDGLLALGTDAPPFLQTDTGLAMLMNSRALWGECSD
jgi:hypothetical protein